MTDTLRSVNGRSLPLALAAAACITLTTPPAHAAVQPARCLDGVTETKGFSAVDDGEIRWTDNTAYDDARKFAISAWQYQGSKIKIVADSAITSNDLEFKDANLGTRETDPLGRYERHGSIGATDYIISTSRSSGACRRNGCGTSPCTSSGTRSACATRPTPSSP
ncbi:hypothetical protein [Streptomyces hydrogenans]|uniref:hypothetical protein n=1 Tax=Streptomyces hydrogenans TaxID=1873719 RepID=UPI0035E1BD69